MPIYAKYVCVLLLVSYKISKAQTDSIPLNHKYQKIEIAVLPVTLNFAVDYFSYAEKFTPLLGLQGKYFISKQNAIRLTFNYSKINQGSITDGDIRQQNYKKTKQFAIGFQHTFIRQKNYSAYWFTDFYYQASAINKTQWYSYYHSQSVYSYTSFDSLVILSQCVNSYNLTGGIGFKFIDRKHAMASIETGFGLGYFSSGTQQAHPFTSTYITTGYAPTYNPSKVTLQQSSSFGQFPEIDTKVKGTNLNICVVRIAVGFIF
jgi:hypothetical protein